MHYKGRDAILEGILYQHFQKIIKDELEHMRQEAEWMKGDVEEFADLSQIDDKIDPNRLNPLIYEIADINFGKGNMKDTYMLQEMGKVQSQKTRLQLKK